MGVCFRLPKWAVRSKSRTTMAGRSIYHHRLRCEALEDRRLLSVFTVSNVNDGPVTQSGALPGSLRQAIYDANANPGADTITFASSLAGQTITLTSGELDLTDTTGTTTITGLGANQLTISGNNASRVFDISGAIVDISGLTISNGYSVNDSGGGVFNGGTVTISNCTISGNLASANGGGIENVGTATITGSTISGNSGQFGGGLQNLTGSLTITGSTISGNSAAGDGGGINNLATLTITNTTISANLCGSAGGGIINGGSLTLDDSTVSENTSVDGGGCIENAGDGTATITNSTISGNSTTREGGGIDNAGTVTLSNSTISENSAGIGGGGIFVDGGWATIIGSSISGNSADGGGGIGNDGWLTIINSSISGNSTSEYGEGGGIVNGRSASITSSTISGNSSSLQGGGIANLGALTITDSTISGNSTSTDGGGIYNGYGYLLELPGVLSIADSTLSRNSASIGGGVYNNDVDGSTTGLANTIAGSNTASTGSPDVSGTVRANYCLVQNTTGTTFTSSSTNNITGVDPLLGTLGNYGGPTQTIPLLPGSPAIDAGSNALAVDGAGNSLTTDQRGYARIVNGTVDIGAYEYVNPLLVTTATDVVDPSDGLTSLREAIAYANSHPGDDTITFDPSLGGQTITLTQGELDLTDTTGTTTITGLGADQLTISGNNASRVLYIDSGVTAEIFGLTITDGYATDGSAGVVNYDGDDYNGGGGIYNAGTLTIEECTISGNSASGQASNKYAGGGIGNIGTMSLTSCTISGNSADYGGGGIGNAGTLTLTNSTIFGNSAFYGAGIGAAFGSTLTIADSTIAGNTASGYGGGIYNDDSTSATTSLRNTIVAGNSAITASPDIDGTVTANYCLIKDTTDTTFSGSSGNNITGVDPLLGPLADNGGPTQTMAHLAGQPGH